MANNLQDLSIQKGRRIAEMFFAKRGNKSEVHLQAEELTALLAVAFQEGYQQPSLGNEENSNGK